MARGVAKSIDVIAGRRRWTAEDATVVLQAAAESGLPLWRFAEQQGLEPDRLYRWRRRLERATPAPEAVRFEEVVIRGVEREERDPHRLELVLASGHMVRVGSRFDAEALRRLLAVLETC
jgi:transposase-like protein